MKCSVAIIVLLICGSSMNENVAGNVVITLQKGNQITCVYPNITSPVFISPPVAKTINPSLLSLNEMWQFDDWQNVNSKMSLLAPVTDKRWEDFETSITKYHVFSFVTSVSFSIYSPEDFEVFARGRSKFEHYKLPTQKDSQQWIHYGIFLIDNILYCLENGHVIYEMNEIYPDQIIVRSKKDLYLKSHEYSFKESTNITKEDLSKFTIPSSTSCILLYTSLCGDCFLEIEIDNGKNIIRRNITQNKFSSTGKLWEENVIEIETNNETQISLFKGSVKDNRQGYWAIDVKSCPDMVDDKGIYKIETSGVPVDRICNVLNSHHKKGNNEVAPITGNSILCSEPGNLGQNCTIRCESILGPQYAHCEQHRMCENNICTCAWNFYGTMCQQKCTRGTIGLSCQESCPVNCKNCDDITGECTDSSSSQYMMAPNIGMIIIPLIAIGIFKL